MTEPNFIFLEILDNILHENPAKFRDLLYQNKEYFLDWCIQTSYKSIWKFQDQINESGENQILKDKIKLYQDFILYFYVLSKLSLKDILEIGHIKKILVTTGDLTYGS